MTWHIRWMLEKYDFSFQVRAIVYCGVAIRTHPYNWNELLCIVAKTWMRDWMKTTISSYQFFNCLLIDRQFDSHGLRHLKPFGLQPDQRWMGIIAVAEYEIWRWDMGVFSADRSSDQTHRIYCALYHFNISWACGVKPQHGPHSWHCETKNTTEIVNIVQYQMIWFSRIEPIAEIMNADKIKFSLHRTIAHIGRLFQRNRKHHPCRCEGLSTACFIIEKWAMCCIW